MSTSVMPRPGVGLEAFFDARSIAVVGASDDSTKIGGRPLHLLRKYGFAGALYPINPKAGIVQGLPAYASVRDIPQAPDMALIAVPAAAAVEAVRDCAARHGVSPATVVAAYDRLQAQGLVQARPQRGFFVRGAALLREQLGERGRVSVTSYNRQVLLVGEVGSDADKALAASLLGSIENVSSVVNEIEVMGQASLSQRTTDAVVTSRLKARLLDARDLHSNAFKVTTNRGVVFLMGRVTPREAERATDIARTTTGVLRVVRAFETISEEELARLLPKPGPQSQPAPNSETRPQ